MLEHQYIDVNEQLADLIARLSFTDRIALDTEADSLHHYFKKVCLIQLSFSENNYIIDPLADVDLSLLLNALMKKRLIIHGADFDLRMLRLDYGFHPHGGIFDTMLAAQLLGHNRISLAGLVKHYFKVNLSKSGQKSDWSRRPLSHSQIEYAVADTHYLELLARRLADELEERGRASWHEESCGWLIEQSKIDSPNDPEREWRVKGWSTLKPKELAFLRELWHCREREAMHVDLPPYRIMDNQKLVSLARAAAKQGALPESSHMLRNYYGKRREALRKAIRRAKDLPQSKWPAARIGTPTRKPGAPKLKELIAENTRIARELGIEPSVLATRSMLENIARRRAGNIEEIMSSGPTRRWQAQLLTPAIKKFLT